MVVLSPVKLLPLVLPQPPVVMENIAYLQTSAWQWVGLGILRIIIRFSSSFSVYCRSNSDCESHIGTTVCKETVPGGAKTCQSSTTCSQICSSGEFCDAANICQYGNLSIQKVIIYHNSIVVTCAVSSDCSSVTGMTSCKEIISGGPLTCQAPSTCLATSLCSGAEYCTSSNICFAAGKYINSQKCYKILVFSFSVFCISSTDCESLAVTTVCKETVSGGSKTCQSSTSCSQVCSSGAFCNTANICQDGKI